MNLRELDGHEHTASEEGYEDTEEPKGEEHGAIQLGEPRGVRLLQDNEPQTAEGEEERGRQALHDVLPVDTVLHKGDGTVVARLIRRGPGCGQQRSRDQRSHDQRYTSPPTIARTVVLPN